MFYEISDHNREVIVDWTKLMGDISSNQDHQLTYTPICMIYTCKWDYLDQKLNPMLGFTGW